MSDNTEFGLVLRLRELSVALPRKKDRDVLEEIADRLHALFAKDEDKNAERIKELETSLQLAEGYLSLIRYRSRVDWGNLGVPSLEATDRVISRARAAMQS